ncbi:MAG: hypothetical protein P8X86_21410 [Desulfofustis sp.]
MVLILRISALIFIGLVITACSSTDMTTSWTNSDFKGPIGKVYVVGIAKDEMNRRIFEDAFSNQFFSERVSSEASYRDITFSKEINKEALAKNMAERGCDAVVLTRLIGQRKETVTTPVYDPVYLPGPYYGGYGRYNRPRHYGSWGSYYGHPLAFSYVPTTTTERIILTVESVMYDLKTEQLIWSAQYETAVEGSIDKMIGKFVEEVAKDLKRKKII